VKANGANRDTARPDRGELRADVVREAQVIANEKDSGFSRRRSQVGCPLFEHEERALGITDRYLDATPGNGNAVALGDESIVFGHVPRKRLDDCGCERSFVGPNEPRLSTADSDCRGPGAAEQDEIYDHVLANPMRDAQRSTKTAHEDIEPTAAPREIVETDVLVRACGASDDDEGSR
jgi:hypothetical protein